MYSLWYKEKAYPLSIEHSNLKEQFGCISLFCATNKVIIPQGERKAKIRYHQQGERKGTPHHPQGDHKGAPLLCYE